RPPATRASRRSASGSRPWPRPRSRTPAALRRGSSRSHDRAARVTATYDPTDPKYFDPAALRDEVDRVFDLCHGCRLCFNLCPSFPTMFGFIDARDGDVASMTDAEHDQVVD